MSNRCSPVLKHAPRTAALVGILLLTFSLLSVSFADEEPGNGAHLASRPSEASGTDRGSVDPEYAKREVMRLGIQLGWAVDRLMEGQTDSEAMKHLLEAAKRCHDRAAIVFGPNDWHTRSALEELHRCQDIDALEPERQRAYWRGRSDLKLACGLYFRQLADGHFRKEGSAAIADRIRDASDRIAAIRPDDPAAVQGYLSMTEVFCLCGEYDSAWEWADKARKAASESDGNSLQLAAAYEFMGVISSARNQYDCATEEFEKALLVLRRYYGGNNSPEYGMCLLNLAFARVKQERYHEAEAYCAVARIILETHRGSQKPFLGRTLSGRTARTCYEYCMAAVYEAFEDYDEAEASIENYRRMSHPKNSNIPNPDAEVKKLAERIKRQKEADAEVARKGEQSAER